MQEKKTLKIGCEKIEKGRLDGQRAWRVWVDEQSHRTGCFGQNGSDCFHNFQSVRNPAFDFDNWFVRGSEEDEDDHVSIVSEDTKDKILDAAQEYNEYFCGEEQEEPEPEPAHDSAKEPEKFTRLENMVLAQMMEEKRFACPKCNNLSANLTRILTKDGLKYGCRCSGHCLWEKTGYFEDPLEAIKDMGGGHIKYGGIEI